MIPGSQSSIPDPRSSIPVSEFRLRRRVQFSEVDSARIVHFSQYFRYMEEAEHAMWREAGLSIAPRGATFGYARIAASFEYHAPLHFEEEFDVLIQVSKITPRTIRYACRVSRGADRIATGAMSVVCVTGNEDGRMVSMAIPAEIASRFAVSPDAAALEAGA